MSFGINGWTGPGMRQVLGFADRSTGRGTFGGAFAGITCIFMNEHHGPLLVLATACHDAARYQITLGRLVINISTLTNSE